MTTLKLQMSVKEDHIRKRKGIKGAFRFLTRIKHQPFSVTLSKESHSFEKCHPERTKLLKEKTGTERVQVGCEL